MGNVRRVAQPVHARVSDHESSNPVRTAGIWGVVTSGVIS